ncbi:pentapeptide repeat-containing protein [Nocardia colli]|uniref:pentapeptide repeat-containing protein n=1 Tax=Nocardia colli TaxID=2545717 RepID=UPI0035D651D7
MSEVEKTTAETAAVGSPDRGLVLMRSRSLLIGLVGTTVGGGVAGFSAALLFGVQAGFSQPLATFLAGAGALSAGVLAYVNGERSRDLSKRQHEADTKRERERHQTDMDRERERHAEDSRRAQVSTLRDRYNAIAAQIADDSAAIRQAGVYALTALADDWHAFGEDDERQVCINLLQWYLRVPFPVGDEPAKRDLSEREIRETIVGIFCERRLRPPDDPKSWAQAFIGLGQASLPYCVLPLINLTGILMRGADLTGAEMAVAKLHGVDLAHANLTGAKLHGADLTGANLTGANLTDANLTGANFSGAHLAEAILTRTDLRAANLESMSLNVTLAQFSSAVHDWDTRWPARFRPRQQNPGR